MSIPYVLSDELRIRRVANQTISSGVPTLVTWDTEDTDTAGFITVPSTTVSIPTNRGGVWAITFKGSSTTDIGSGRSFIDTTAAGITYRRPFGTTVADETTTVPIFVRLADAAVLTFTIFHTAGGNRDFVAFLQMHRLGF